jgi:hypothetical protein
VVKTVGLVVADIVPLVQSDLEQLIKVMAVAQVLPLVVLALIPVEVEVELVKQEVLFFSAIEEALEETAFKAQLQELQLTELVVVVVVFGDLQAIM